VVVAKEAAIAEALTDLRAHAEASEEKEVAK
jgi:predicted component of type VI protein secretion system